MFDELYERAMNTKPEQKVVLDLSQDMFYNPNLFTSKLENIDKISDTELFDLIRSYYNSLLSDLFIGNRKYISLFTNARFLTIFTQVISNVQDLSYNNKVYCNKLAYDYTTLPNPDPDIKQLLYSLSRVVNRNIIPGLLGLGLPNDLACYIALTRYSSQRENINVKRLNLVLINSPIEIMTEQMIVFIYEKLFDRLTPLFEGTMFDIYDKFETESAENIYSIISLSILDILEAQTSATIRKVLLSYEADYKTFHAKSNGKPARFSMQCLSPDDYPRINTAIENLKLENIFVP